MKRYTAADLLWQGTYIVDTLLELSLTARVNRHALLCYRGLISEEQAKEALRQSGEGARMQLTIDNTPVFSGMIASTQITKEGEDFILEVRCASMSKQLDFVPKSRSFQDTKMSYAEMLEQVYQEAENASIITVRGEEHIGVPLLQYMETDWQYTLRMAGRLGAVVVPNLTATHAQAALGFPKGKHYQVSQTETDYAIRRNNMQYIQNGRQKAQAHYKSYLQYSLQDSRLFRLGDRVAIADEELMVVQFSYKLSGDDLITQYLLGTEEEFCVTPFCNEKQAGLSLPGVVLATSGQTAKLHLDIDKRQDAKSAYSFSYAPQTNNGMYSMPQAGAKAMLRWNSSGDGDAMIVHSIHERGAFGDYQDRSFTTEFGKQMAMLPSLLSFTGGGNSLSLSDSGGITGKTGQELVLRARGLLSIRSKKKVIFKTPEQLKMLMPGKKVSAIDVRGGQLHMKSSQVVICGDTGKKKLPAKPHAATIVKTINSTVLQAANGMLPMTGKAK